MKKQRHYFANKDLCHQSYDFYSSYVGMWELEYKESWALKNWCFWTVVLEKTLESPLDCKEIQPVNPKGNQSWILIVKTDAEADTPILYPPDSFQKTLMLGLTEVRRRRGRQWMRRLDGITESRDMNFSKLQGLVMDSGAWCTAVHWVTKSWTRLSNWTELNKLCNLKEMEKLLETYNLQKLNQDESEKFKQTSNK